MKLSTTKIIQLLILCTVFLFPFYFFRFKICSLPTNIFEVAVLLVFLIFLVFDTFNLIDKKADEKYKKIGVNFQNYLIILFLVASVFASYQADFSREALGILKGWFIVPGMLYYLIIKNFSKKEIYKISIPIFVSLVLVSLWAILQKLGVISTLFYQSGDQSFSQYLTGNFRVFGPFESPNYLAMYLVPAMFLSLGIFFTLRKIYFKIAFVLLYIMPISALVLSGSRAGIIAFISSILILIFIREKKQVASDILYYSLGVLLIISGIFFFWKFGFNPASDSVRIEIYNYALKILSDNWLSGIGLGSFYNIISEYSANALSFKTHALPYAIHPHNIFLGVWLNLGLMGIVIFLAIIINFFVQLFRNRDRSILFISAFLSMSAILIHGLFDSTYFKNDLSTIFFITLSFAYIIWSVENEEKN